LAATVGALNFRVSGFFSCTLSPFSTSSVISASIRAIPTGAGRTGSAGRAGGVSGLKSALSMPLPAALVVPGILDMVDDEVMGVDCCPCSVMLVPVLGGLLTRLERGRPIWGATVATVAPRRGRFCGKRLVLWRALVEALGSGSGLLRLGRTGGMPEGDPVPVFCMFGRRGGRLVGRKGWVPGCRVASTEGEK